MDIIGRLSQLGGHHNLLRRDEGLRIVALDRARLRFHDAAVRVGHIRGVHGGVFREGLGAFGFRPRCLRPVLASSAYRVSSLLCC